MCPALCSPTVRIYLCNQKHWVCADYVVYLYAAEQRLKHVAKALHIIEFITILPALITFFVKVRSWLLSCYSWYTAKK